ncbi:transposase [Xenorhabdus sp. PB62.4]|nr:transposase [Xenorhabdus sp. PB62.4]
MVSCCDTFLPFYGETWLKLMFIVVIVTNQKTLKDMEKETEDTRIKRLNRKTLGYSKSEEMHDKVIGTFIERENYV